MGAPKIEQISQDELIGLLGRSSIFVGADPAALTLAAASSEVLVFKKGDSIILENEPNRCVHFIADGEVEIATYLTAEKRVQRLLLLGPGNQFGEFSALTKSARSGSAYAFTDCVIVRMQGEAFVSLLETYPVFAVHLLGNLARFSQASLSTYEFIPFYSDAKISLSEQILQILPQAMWKKFGVIPVSLRAGVLSVVMVDPHQPNFFQYVTGQFPKLEVSVSMIGEREFQSLFEAASSSKPVAPVRPVPLGELDLFKSLTASTLFQGFDPRILQSWIARFQLINVKAGSPVVNAGQALTESYLVLRGAVQLSRPLRTKSPLMTAPVLLLKSGDSFGDELILLDSPSPYSCRALEDTDLIAIPKDAMNVLLDEPKFLMSLIRSFALRLQTLGHVSGMTFVHPETKFDFDSVSSIFSSNLIDQEKVLPLKLERDELILGMVRPERAGTLLKVDRYLADYRVRVVGITEEQFKAYRGLLKVSVAEAEPAVTAVKPSAKPEPGHDTTDVVKWVDGVLAEGMRNGASDIHFEPSSSGLMTRFRIDGVLRESGLKLSAELTPQAISRLKILAAMDISIQHVPQDGHLATTSENIKIMARANSLPIKAGEKIVLRLIRERNSVVPLEMIAPDRRIVSYLKSVAERRQGLFLVTGPTGSGKTTTLYSLMKLINQVDVNVISIEDPVEMELRGVNQVEINTKRGLEFAHALKSVLRQDPDVVMVGEIRDESSAKIVFDAAMTGCLVLSTLHSGTSLEAISRLKDLGVSPSQIAEGLVGVITQRLVRQVCKGCGKDHPTDDRTKEMFARVPGLDVPATVKRGAGCQACSQTGYQGRVPVFEMWGRQGAMSDKIRSGGSTAELEVVARQTGYESLFEFALRLVQSGTTTPEEVRRVLSGTGSLF